MEIPRSLLKELKVLRREIHQYPELSGEEYETRDRLLSFIRPCDPDDIYMMGETGLAVAFNGKEEGPVIHFRAELDALPIDEINDFSYASRNEGVSHKCGHDGHMTVVAGLSRLFAENPPDKGRVILLFQPAEEDGRGAISIFNDPKFDQIKPDYVFAFHNLPGFDMHQVVYKSGTFTAAAKSLIIKMEGKTSHAAEPEKGINPAYVISGILEASTKIMQTNPEKKDFSLITPVYMKLGEAGAYGVSAGCGDLRVTLRSFSNKSMNILTDKLNDIIHKIADKHGVKVTVEETETFQANMNDEESVEFVKKAAEEIGADKREISFPFKWGEDYGVFTDKFPGAMFGIGSGRDQPALHNPDYDFPDEIIETGMKMFYGISKQILK